MKTIRVKALVRQVLEKVPSPYTMHIIDDVFHSIETNPQWLREYNRLCDELGKSVVNAWCGQWTASALGKQGEVQVPSRKSTLIGSYSLLDTDARRVVRKPTEEDALVVMAEYYLANRATLPSNIRNHRDEIVELLKDGVPVEEAFQLFMPSTSTKYIQS